MHTIQPEKGLPDTLSFYLDFTGDVHASLLTRATSPAPLWTFCFSYMVDIIGLGTNVTSTVSISVAPTAITLRQVTMQADAFRVRKGHTKIARDKRLAFLAHCLPQPRYKTHPPTLWIASRPQVITCLPIR